MALMFSRTFRYILNLKKEGDAMRSNKGLIGGACFFISLVTILISTIINNSLLFYSSFALFILSIILMTIGFKELKKYGRYNVMDKQVMQKIKKEQRFKTREIKRLEFEEKRQKAYSKGLDVGQKFDEEHGHTFDLYN